MRAGRGERRDQEIDNFTRRGTVRIFLRVILRHVEAQKILVRKKLRERGLHFLKGKPTTARHIRGGQIILGNDIKIDVQGKLSRFGVQLRQRVLR